jgi:hypothetical protein
MGYKLCTPVPRWLLGYVWNPEVYSLFRCSKRVHGIDRQMGRRQKHLSSIISPTVAVSSILTKYLQALLSSLGAGEGYHAVRRYMGIKIGIH